MFRKNKQAKVSAPNSAPRPKSAPALREEDLLKKYNSVPKAIPSAPSADSPSAIVFHCQLAHGSPTGFVSGFSNSPELYQKIATVYDIPVSEVIDDNTCSNSPPYKC